MERYSDCDGPKNTTALPLTYCVSSSLAPSSEEAEIARRLVFLRANDDYIGVLGLLQYIKPEKEAVNVSDKAFHPGTTIMVFNHADVKGVFEKARELGGVNILYEPTETSYPSYDGTSTIRVLVSVLQDPDGFTLEVNEVLSELK